jgi:CheY-like chemotaxis protein
MMEVFGARPNEPTEVVADEIRRADALIGIYAHRYGFIPPGAGVSITEQEFDLARDSGIPIFGFLVDESYPWLPKFIETEPGQSKLKSFKEKILKIITRETFTTPDDLGFKVSSSLGRFLLANKVKAELENSSPKQVSSEQGRDQVSRRAARIQGVIEGAHVLLVNDEPSDMYHVVNILNELKIEVKIVSDSDEALTCIKASKYDVVISDMRRGAVADEGLRFLNRVRLRGRYPAIIFTVGDYQPKRGTPPYSFGITDRVDELLNLLFDAIERTRG